MNGEVKGEHVSMVNVGQTQHGRDRAPRCARRLAAALALALVAPALAAAAATPALALLADAQSYTSTLTFAELPPAVTLAFDANGGSFAPESASVDGGTLSDDARTYFYQGIQAGTPFGALPQPTRADHDFAGWWTEPTGGERIAIKVPETDATYYAHWRHASLVFWALDADGLLVVAPSAEAAAADRATTATGSFAAADDSGHPGWEGEAERIRSVVVTGGVRPRSCERWFATENSVYNYFDFTGYPNLVSADLSGLDGSALTSLRAMFANCRQLERVTFGQLDTSHVTEMNWMFLYCSALTSLDLSSFETARVTNMSYLLDGCIALESLTTGEGWTSAAPWYGFPSARLPRAMSEDGGAELVRGAQLSDGPHRLTAAPRRAAAQTA